MSGLATEPKALRGCWVYCPRCHTPSSHTGARAWAIAAAAAAEKAKAAPRHGDTMPVSEILTKIEGCSEFLASDQLILLPIRGPKGHRGSYKVLSDGVLAPGMTQEQVNSRRALAAALIRARWADEGWCPRCIAIEVDQSLPAHLAFEGGGMRMYRAGGHFAPRTDNGDEQSFIEWGVELHALGHDTAGDPRFHGEWAGKEHRGILKRRQREKQNATAS